MKARDRQDVRIARTGPPRSARDSPLAARVGVSPGERSGGFVPPLNLAIARESIRDT